MRAALGVAVALAAVAVAAILAAGRVLVVADPLPPRADAIVVLRRRAASTESEARTIARWACRQGVRRLVVVTSRAHTRRARLILRQALGRGIELAMRPSRSDAFTAARWWRVRRDAKLVLSEYEKLANYWLTQSWRIAPCGGIRRRD